MKKLKLTLISFGLLLSIISAGQTALTFRFANPKITYYTASVEIPIDGDYFEFDIQVKATALQYLYSGEIALTLNSSSLVNDAAGWLTSKGTVLSGTTGISQKYNFLPNNITAGIVRLPFAGNITSLNRNPFTTTNWNQISTIDFQTLMHVKVWIDGLVTGLAGIDFDVAMNGKFSFITGTSTLSPYGTNVYDPADFTNTYLGRIYANSTWTQTGGSSNGIPYTNWATAVNTSVWDGSATIPTTGVSNASNLRIHNPATLTIPSTGQLTVTGNTDINNPNGLILQSDATNAASLITATASGSANVQRYMAATSWRIATSPVAGQEIISFLLANPTIATNTNTDLRGMTDYVMATNTWSSFFSQTTAPGNVEVGKGYMLRAKTGGAGPVTFSGSLNAAATIVPLTMAGTNWNCVGNPFTSAIKKVDLINNNLSLFETGYEALYVYNGATYDIVNLTNGPLTIQAGQGFFVKAKSASDLAFATACKIHDNASVLKSGDATPEIKLIVQNGDITVSTLIKFMAGASNGLDVGYDAGIFKSDIGLNIYTRLVEDNGIDFGLQCLPVNNLNSLVIPVGIDSKAGGDVEFSAEAINLEVDGKIILEDKLSKTFTDLSEGDYKTTLEANSITSDRFQIHTSYLTTGISGDFLKDQLSAYAVRNTEIRVKGTVTNQAVATLYDVQGRVILVKNLQEGSFNLIPTPNLHTGIYLLSVKDSGRVQVFKVPVKE